MRIAIIGAGVSGLASARRCLENGFEPIVYERTKRVGGTWVYDERIGLDEFGLPVHTSMYQNLMYVATYSCLQIYTITIVYIYTIYIFINIFNPVSYCVLGRICPKN